MYQEKFQNILGENEEIIRIEKAKKATFVSKKIISIIITISIILGLCYYTGFLLSTTSLTNNLSWINYVSIGIAIIILLNIIFSVKAYSNYFLCLTNKRIIIRYGSFTNNYSQYSIDNVTGNIQTICTQSIWDKKDGKNASGIIFATIELLPVGHKSIYISTRYSIENSFEMAKEIEKVVKSNAKLPDQITKE